MGQILGMGALKIVNKKQIKNKQTPGWAGKLDPVFILFFSKVSIILVSHSETLGGLLDEQRGLYLTNKPNSAVKLLNQNTCE